MIREAQIAEIERLTPMCREMHIESRYAGCAFSEAKMDTLIYRLITSPAGIALVSPNGLLLGAVSEYWFSNEKYAFEYVLYVRPEKRGSLEAVRLIKSYILKARSLGAKEIHIENTTCVETDRTERLFQLMGFSRIGGNFIMTTE